MSAVEVALRCAEKDCDAHIVVEDYAPSVAVDRALRLGWAVEFGSANYLAHNAKALCSEHDDVTTGERDWDEVGDDAITRHEAKCFTCHERHRGTKADCNAWAQDHECEPDVMVRKVDR